MAEITALIWNTGSGILAGFIDVYSAVIDVRMKVLFNPDDEFLMVLLPALHVSLKCGWGKVKRA
jgi:site-specific recombinase